MRPKTAIIIMNGGDINSGRFSDILSPEGYRIYECRCCTDMPDIRPSLLIVCSLPVGEIEIIRRYYSVPLMFISDSADEYVTITALTKGADSVVRRDIPEIEFAARVQALLRRGTVPAAEENIRTEKKLYCGELTINTAARTVFIGEKQIKTTVIEYGILEYLAFNRGRVCPADEIYRAVWKNHSYGVRKNVVEHVRRLRRKLGDNAKDPQFIRAVFGMGYFMPDISMQTNRMDKTA